MMVARAKEKTMRQRLDAWLDTHPTLGCILIGVSVACALVVLFAFVTFSGFGASAEFIYNQF